MDWKGVNELPPMRRQLVASWVGGVKSDLFKAVASDHAPVDGLHTGVHVQLKLEWIGY